MAVAEIVVIAPTTRLDAPALTDDTLGVLFDTVTSAVTDTAVPSDFVVSALTCPVPCALAVNTPLVSMVPMLPTTDHDGDETVINFSTFAFPLASTPYTVNCCMSPL